MEGNIFSKSKNNSNSERQHNKNIESIEHIAKHVNLNEAKIPIQNQQKSSIKAVLENYSQRNNQLDDFYAKKTDINDRKFNQEMEKDQIYKTFDGIQRDSKKSPQIHHLRNVLFKINNIEPFPKFIESIKKSNQTLDFLKLKTFFRNTYSSLESHDLMVFENYFQISTDEIDLSKLLERYNQYNLLTNSESEQSISSSNHEFHEGSQNLINKEKIFYEKNNAIKTYEEKILNSDTQNKNTIEKILEIINSKGIDLYKPFQKGNNNLMEIEYQILIDFFESNFQNISDIDLKSFFNILENKNGKITLQNYKRLIEGLHSKIFSRKSNKNNNYQNSIKSLKTKNYFNQYREIHKEFFEELSKSKEFEEIKDPTLIFDAILDLISQIYMIGIPIEKCLANKLIDISKPITHNRFIIICTSCLHLLKASAQELVKLLPKNKKERFSWRKIINLAQKIVLKLYPEPSIKNSFKDGTPYSKILDELLDYFNFNDSGLLKIGEISILGFLEILNKFKSNMEFVDKAKIIKTFNSKKNGYISLDDIMRVYINGKGPIIEGKIKVIEEKISRFFELVNVRVFFYTEMILPKMNCNMFMDLSNKIGLSKKEGIILFYLLKINNKVYIENLIQEITKILLNKKRIDNCSIAIEKILKNIVKNTIDKKNLIEKLSLKDFSNKNIPAKSFEQSLTKLNFNLNNGELNIISNYFDIFHTNSFNIHSFTNILYKIIELNKWQYSLNLYSKTNFNKDSNKFLLFKHYVNRNEISIKCKKYFDDKLLQEKLCEFYFDKIRMKVEEKIHNIAYFTSRNKKNHIHEKESIDIVKNFLSIFTCPDKETLSFDEFSMFLTFIGASLMQYQIDQINKSFQIRRKLVGYVKSEENDNQIPKNMETFDNLKTYQFKEKNYFKNCKTIFNSFDAAYLFCKKTYEELENNKQIFEDPDFGPQFGHKQDEYSAKSLYFNGKNPKHYPRSNEVIWLHMIQEPNKAKLFDNTISCNDVIQGDSFDCWFISALNIISMNKVFISGIELKKNSSDKYTEKEKLIKLQKGMFSPLFLTYSKVGIYCVKFHKNGKWRYVVVDDRIPCTIKDGIPEKLFCKCTNINELWGPIAEKAYAKLHGCYQSLDYGYIHNALEDLTGMPVQTFSLDKKLKNSKYSEKIDKFWNIITLQNNRGSMMGCAIETEPNSDNPSKEGKAASYNNLPTGLIDLHAYAILGIYELPRNKKNQKREFARLLRIKNPWGQKEWTLKWSDYSEEVKIYKKKIKDLNKEIDKSDRMKLGLDDGIFFINYKSWRNIFTEFYICHDYSGDWKDIFFNLYWDEHNSFPLPENDNNIRKNFEYSKNPQIILTILGSSANVIATLSQEDDRINLKSTDKSEENILENVISIFKLPDGASRLEKYEENNVIKKSKIAQNRNNFLKASLTQGIYSIIPRYLSTVEKQKNIKENFRLQFIMIA